MKINSAARLRDFSIMRAQVTSPEHAAVSAEVANALAAWISSKQTAAGVLIGGLAMSFYAPPRYTQDVDILFLSRADIPEHLDGFRKHRAGAFEDVVSNVEVEVVTPSQINLPLSVARRIVDTAREFDSLKVASLEGLIVLKLFGSDDRKRYHSDLGDIQRLLSNNPSLKLIDFKEWGLSEEHSSRLQSLLD